MITVLSFVLVLAVTRLKADNPLYGSSLIDYVRYFCIGETYFLTMLKIFVYLNKKKVAPVCTICAVLIFLVFLVILRPVLSSGWILLQPRLMPVFQNGFILDWVINCTFLQ